MTQEDHHSAQVKLWLHQVSARLSCFQKTASHNLSSNEQREWWLKLFLEGCTLMNTLEQFCHKITVTETGCWVPPNRTVARLRLKGRRIYAYQLVYWGGNTLIPAQGEVVRHRCHNRKCVNPEHLEHGTQRDNKHDEVTKWITGPQ